MLENLSKTNFTILNGANLTNAVHLYDGDEIVISERAFRFATTRPTPASRTPFGTKTKSIVSASSAAAAVDENAAPNVKPKAPAKSALKPTSASSASASSSAAAVAKAKADADAKAQKEAAEAAAAAAAAAAQKAAEEAAAAAAAAAAQKEAEEAAAAAAKAAAAKAKAEKRARSNSLSKVEVKPRVEAEPTPAVPGTMATPSRKQKRKLAKTPKKPITMPTPVKQGIVEKSSKHKATYEMQAMPTPMRKSIVDKAVARPVTVPVMAMATPARAEIKAKSSKHRVVYDVDKKLETPVRAAISGAAGKHAAAYNYVEHHMATPIKEQLLAKASEPNAAFAPVEAVLHTPVRNELRSKADAFDRVRYAPGPKLESPLKKSIAEKSVQVAVAREQRLEAEKKAAEAKAAAEKAAAEEAAAKEKEAAAEKAAALAAEAKLAQEALEAKIKLEAEHKATLAAAEKALAEEEAAAEAAANDDVDGDDDDDEDDDDDDDDIQVNMPQRIANDAGMKTPVRKGAAPRTPDGRVRVMYVNEHTTGTPMRDALFAAATPIVAAEAPQDAHGMPTPLKLSIGAAATDAAIRRAVAAQKSLATAARETAADEDSVVMAKAPEAQQFKLFTVDVDAAASAIEAQLHGLEEKLSGKCTKPQMEEAVRAAIAAIRGVVANLSDAGASVAADVIEKCVAINAVAEEQALSKAAPVVDVVAVSEPVAVVVAEPVVVAAEEKKTRGRPRKSIAAVAEPVVAEAAPPTEKTPAKPKKASRKSIVEAPVEEEKEPETAVRRGGRARK